jgi:hypothetical protein
LIVEDEMEWARIYERAAVSQNPDLTVMIAKDLTGAARMIEIAKFAVAFVDIGLDISDDHNVDGLLVMERIRAVGDETSIVVITGRSGQDVLPITRDAIIKYNAYDAIGKASIGPYDIRRLLQDGLAAYSSAVATDRITVGVALRTVVGAMSGDQKFMQVIQLGSELGHWYDFLNELFGEYLPIMPTAGSGSEMSNIDHPAGVAYGSYWSRAAAGAVFLCIGSAEMFDEFIDAVRANPGPLGKYRFGPTAKELYAHGVKGGAFLLQE